MNKKLWWSRPNTGDSVLRNDTGECWRVKVGATKQIIHSDYMEVLREYFRDERDRELGRWRDPENPEWVAYSAAESDEDGLVVANESTGEGMRYFRDEDEGEKQEHPWENPFARTARRYYRTNPVNKPWHNAKHGEVWVITTENVSDEVAVQVYNGANFAYVDGVSKPIKDVPVKTARRIWPENKESDNEY